ncbi:hypothetical protein LINPERPRIM_LOCUS875 [Linum perenne]
MGFLPFVASRFFVKRNCSLYAVQTPDAGSLITKNLSYNDSLTCDSWVLRNCFTRLVDYRYASHGHV